MFEHIVNHIKHKCVRSEETLHVIGVITNPVRFNSRYRLFKRWVKEMLDTPNVTLHVVEGVYGDRHPECKPENGEYSYKAFHIHSEIWLKENLINLGVRYLLPKNWKYMAWVDCDVSFRNHNWATETLHQLQHYKIVQPWSDAVDLTFDGGIHKHFQSFGYLCAKRIPQAPSGNNPYNHKYGHTGFAWACTRYFYENIEKLLDFAILGAGDNHMAWACLGKVIDTMNPEVTDGYKHAAKAWQTKAKYACGAHVGYTPGRIEHHFHGPKTRRQYWSRWRILVKYKFDPLKDLKYDAHGILKLKGKTELEQAIMHYNRERLEDSVENY
jgi:hypothetical protein